MCRFILIAAVFFSLKSFSQSIDISKNWLVTIGDTSNWSGNSYDDTHWKRSEKAQPFEQSGFEKFKNFGWVRKKIVIPSSLKDSAEKYGYFFIALGRINDADQTFFNGKLVGQMGGMPPAHIQVDRGMRVYKVDVKEIFWDKENLIAVRIFSNFHNGGLWDENFYIIIPSENIFHLSQKIIPGFVLEKGQQSYEASTKADISLKREALKEGGLALQLILPVQSSVFYNGEYIGKSGFAGLQSFFVPASFIAWDHPDKITIYTNDSSTTKILFSTPRFGTIPGNGFYLMQVLDFKIKKGSFNSHLPVHVSAKVFNTTNTTFDGVLTLTLSTDINSIQQSSSHLLHLNLMESKEIDFTLIPNFSGVYQVNYILLKNDTGQKIMGTLKKGEKV
jgi:hypothetical protein